jgi:hypothetical protein
MASLTQEFEYYKANQDKLVKQYDGKFIVIIGTEVIGSYDTYEDAVQQTLTEHELGTFLVQYVHAGDDNYSQTFHSRVVVNGR